MEHCKELSESSEIVQRNALIGYLTYTDETFMPGVLLDLSKDPFMEERVKELYRKDRFNRFEMHIDETQTVSVDSGKDLLDGHRLENLYIRFTPEYGEDIDKFMFWLEFTHYWKLIIRLSDRELHFSISADTDDVSARRISRRMCEFKAFPPVDGDGRVS